MKIEVKEGVIFKEFNDEFFEFAEAVWAVWLRRGVTPVITSAFEGKHIVGSLHYKHLAWDLRARTLADPEKAVAELKEILNKFGHKYDIIYFNDDKGQRIHAEFQPR